MNGAADSEGSSPVDDADEGNDDDGNDDGKSKIAFAVVVALMVLVVAIGASIIIVAVSRKRSKFGDDVLQDGALCCFGLAKFQPACGLRHSFLFSLTEPHMPIA